MNKSVLVLRSMAVGWILAVTILMIVLPMDPSTSAYEYSFGEILGYYFVFGFPGFIMFMLAMIFALDDNKEEVDGGIKIKEILKRAILMDKIEELENRLKK